MTNDDGPANLEMMTTAERGQRDAHRNQSKKDSGAKVPVKPLEKAPPGKDTRSQLEEELRPQLEKEIRSVLEVEIRDRLEKQIRPQLESEIRPQLEREVRLALEKEVFVELEKERERAQARTQDLERQVRELEVILRKRQQTSSVLPCSPARERQLQDQLVQLEKDVGERRAAERQLQEQLRNAEEQLQERHAAASRVQAHLHAVKGKYEGLVSSLEQQLSDARQEVSDLKERALLVPPKAPSVPSVPSSASSEAGDAQDAQDAQDELQHDAKDASSRREPRGGALRRRPRPRRSQSVGEPAVGPPSASSGTSGTSGAATPSGEGHVIQVMPHQQNRPTPPAKPETHLLATIRGLQHELQTKEKEMAKLNRELSDARSTNRRLQQERQRLLNESASRPKTAPAAAAAAPPPAPDPDLEAENRGLRRDVTRLQEDLLSLHAKRVSDLTRLQAKHEEELESIVCERVNERLSDRSCEGRVAELQGQLYTQQLVIAHLKEQLKHSEHNSEEVALLKRERDQLEKSVMSLTKQVSRLKEAASPDAQRVAALQEQVDELEARHETRERKLQAIVRDLLHRQDQHDGDRGASSMSSSDAVACSCPAAVRLLHKNRDLCFYRAEMDRLLEALRELERSRKGSGPK